MFKSILSINLAMLILLHFTSLAHSDTITLKTGSIIEGLIIQEGVEKDLQVFTSIRKLG